MPGVALIQPALNMHSSAFELCLFIGQSLDLFPGFFDVIRCTLADMTQSTQIVMISPTPLSNVDCHFICPRPL